MAKLYFLITLTSIIFLQITPVFSKSISITEKGVVIPKNPNAIMLQFFVTVQNLDKEIQTVVLEINQCCLKIGLPESGGTEYDCDSMDLPSLLPRTLAPGETSKFSTFFVNKYLDKRQGYCKMIIKWSSTNNRNINKRSNGRHQRSTNTISKFTDEEEVNIAFNTYSRNKTEPGFFQNIFNSFRKTENTKCPNDTEDLTEDCKPVDCLIKYDGHKSFFNKINNKCEKIPGCFTQRNNRGLPDQVVSRVTNKCIPSNVPFTDEMTELKDVVEVGALSYKTYPIKISCLNGQRTDEGCKCDLGWTSVPLPTRTFNPEVDIYQMCDTEMGMGNAKIQQSSSSSSTLMVLVFLVAVLCVVCCVVLPFCVREYKNSKERATAIEPTPFASKSPSQVIAEVLNRRELMRPQEYSSPSPSPTISLNPFEKPTSSITNPLELEFNETNPPIQEPTRTEDNKMELKESLREKTGNKRNAGIPDKIIKKTTKKKTVTIQINNRPEESDKVNQNSESAWEENNQNMVGTPSLRTELPAAIMGIDFHEEYPSPENSKMTIVSSSSDTRIADPKLRRNLSGMSSLLASSQSDIVAGTGASFWTLLPQGTTNKMQNTYYAPNLSRLNSYSDFQEPSRSENKLREMLSGIYDLGDDSAKATPAESADTLLLNK